MHYIELLENRIFNLEKILFTITKDLQPEPKKFLSN